ncbi:MAG: hypothetical protein F4X56_01175 [Gammaproteobacteria bacterium]|nr:hypothetical protein [Gammaproteobacteria bacterium]
MKFKPSPQFTEFNVALIAERMNANLVNETILRKQGIIEASDVAIPTSTLLSPFHSRLNFENGLSIIADPTSLTISQLTSASLTPEENRCPRIAEDFINTINFQTENPNFNSIGIFFKATIDYPQECPATRPMVRFFADCADWARFGTELPEFRVQVLYRSKPINKIIRVDIEGVQNSEGNALTGELYHANFRHEIPTDNPALTATVISEILGTWEDDLSEFSELISRYCAMK